MMIQNTRTALGAAALAVAMIVLSTGPSAVAENPANWNFLVETTGSDTQWDSPTQVDTGFPFYKIDFEVTELKALFGPAALNLFAVGVDPDDYKGSAIVPGPLPIVILSDAITNDDNDDDVDDTVIDVALWIDGAGQGHLGLSNVLLGPFNGNQVSGFRMGGTFNIEGIVPEPTSLVLLSCGGLATLLTRRRRA